ncbi:hypothetical protein AVEN_98716-1 [Araneus ventricosus]|uniref:Uncharacterized protein n=1 Tax=Araneus ventricosus TaxID=182803 RepID=A0A4Y2HFZ9_ARAVE|nr:hypothetical protein AVEN_98716-1 [Araneus ventricosus]
MQRTPADIGTTRHRRWAQKCKTTSIVGGTGNKTPLLIRRLLIRVLVVPSGGGCCPGPICVYAPESWRNAVFPPHPPQRIANRLLCTCKRYWNCDRRLCSCRNY